MIRRRRHYFVFAMAAVVAAAVLTMATASRPRAVSRSASSNSARAKIKAASYPNAALYHFTGKHAFARLKLASAKHSWPAMPIGDLMGVLGLRLLDTPYVNYTLDQSADKEYCVVNLQELDCVT